MTAAGVRTAARRLGRRKFPILAAIGLILIGMAGDDLGTALLRPDGLGRPR